MGDSELRAKAEAATYHGGLEQELADAVLGLLDRLARAEGVIAAALDEWDADTGWTEFGTAVHRILSAYERSER